MITCIDNNALSEEKLEETAEKRNQKKRATTRAPRVLYTVRRRRTVFEHSLLAVLAQESREFGLRLLHVVREVVLVAPLAVEGPVRPLTLTAAEVNGVTSRAQGETVLVRCPAVAALLWHVFLLLEVRRHICLVVGENVVVV